MIDNPTTATTSENSVTSAKLQLKHEELMEKREEECSAQIYESREETNKAVASKQEERKELIHERREKQLEIAAQFQKLDDLEFHGRRKILDATDSKRNHDAFRINLETLRAMWSDFKDAWSFQKTTFKKTIREMNERSKLKSFPQTGILNEKNESFSQQLIELKVPKHFESLLKEKIDLCKTKTKELGEEITNFEMFTETYQTVFDERLQFNMEGVKESGSDRLDENCKEARSSLKTIEELITELDEIIHGLTIPESNLVQETLNENMAALWDSPHRIIAIETSGSTNLAISDVTDEPSGSGLN